MWRHRVLGVMRYRSLRCKFWPEWVPEKSQHWRHQQARHVREHEADLDRRPTAHLLWVRLPASMAYCENCVHVDTLRSFRKFPIGTAAAAYRWNHHQFPFSANHHISDIMMCTSSACRLLLHTVMTWQGSSSVASSVACTTSVMKHLTVNTFLPIILSSTWGLLTNTKKSSKF